MARSAILSMPMRNQVFRQFQRDARETFTRTRGERIAERQTLREKLMAAPGPNGRCIQGYVGKHIHLILTTVG